MKFDLSTNEFSGNLPNMTSFTSIQFVDFSANNFSGTLPPTLSNKQLYYMRSFDASSNALTGFFLFLPPIHFSLIPNHSFANLL